MDGMDWIGLNWIGGKDQRELHGYCGRAPLVDGLPRSVEGSTFEHAVHQRYQETDWPTYKHTEVHSIIQIQI